MAKGKVISTKALPGGGAKGGSGKMFGQQHAGNRAPDATGKKDKGAGGKFAAGGRGKMFGKQSASPRKSGQTGK